METYNRHHANRPTRYTAADYARMADAVARHDARIARAAMKARLYCLAYCCTCVAVAVAMFYAGTN